MACKGSLMAGPRRRVWPEAEKRWIVAEVAAGGVFSEMARPRRSRQSFCAAGASVATPSFVPVALAEDSAPAVAVPVPVPVPTLSARDDRAMTVEVVLANGRRLVVDERIAPGLVAAIEGSRANHYCGHAHKYRRAK